MPSEKSWFTDFLGIKPKMGGGEVKKVPEQQESEIVRLAKELSCLSDEVLEEKIPAEYQKGKRREVLALLKEIRDRIVEVATAKPSSGTKLLQSTNGLLRLSRKENGILIVGHNKVEYSLGLCRLVHFIFPIIEVDTW